MSGSVPERSAGAGGLGTRAGGRDERIPLWAQVCVDVKADGHAALLLHLLNLNKKELLRFLGTFVPPSPPCWAQKPSNITGTALSFSFSEEISSFRAAHGGPDLEALRPVLQKGLQEAIFELDSKSAASRKGVDVPRPSCSREQRRGLPRSLASGSRMLLAHHWLCGEAAHGSPRWHCPRWHRSGERPSLHGPAGYRAGAQEPGFFLQFHH